MQYMFRTIFLIVQKDSMNLFNFKKKNVRVIMEESYCTSELTTKCCRR